MGGDDLGSDDEYLDLNLTSSNEKSFLNNADIIENDDNDDGVSKTTATETKTRKSSSSRKSEKRKASVLDEVSVAMTTKDKPVHKLKFLLEIGRDIVNQSKEIQSAFLWSCYTHFLKDKNDKNLSEKTSIFNPSLFVSSQSLPPTTSDISPLGHMLKSNISSIKQLKKWKALKSPMVLIVCISARRATSILKSISFLNTRTAKLFPKNMQLSQQISMLQSTGFGIAVGTPNRLLKLSTEQGGGGTPALSLNDTELFIIDCHQDQKRFTVCTLNDVAPDLMEFTRTAVHPQFDRKKPIKIAFV